MKISVALTVIFAATAVFGFDPNKDVKYTLYTRAIPTGENIIPYIDWMSGTKFGKNKPTRFLIHGYNSGWGDPLNKEIAQKYYLKVLDANVIYVDWGAGASGTYSVVRQRVPAVAQQVGKFANFLFSNKFTTPAQTVFIGHSLGAHIAGLGASATIQKFGKIKAVVGLDPAAPEFDINKPQERISKSNANYVQIIHTDGSGFGLNEAIGHGDFYPNDGQSQAGCAFLDIFCDHNRAITYFGESIKYKKFYGTKCANYGEVLKHQCTAQGKTRYQMAGEPLDTNAIGVFRLTTNDKSPFGKG